MAVQAQFGGLLLPPYAADDQIRALKDYGALLSTAAAAAPEADGCYTWQQYDDYCAGQSELTCTGGPAVMPLPPVLSRKRGREKDDDDLLHYAPLLLPPPVIRRPHIADSSAATALPSTSGRYCAAAVPVPAPAEQGALASELLLWRQMNGVAEAEVDALVRAECDRLRAEWLEAARRERQRRALVRAAAAVSSSGMLARRAREAEAQLEAARRRAAELEERVVLAAAEAQAWCAVARGNEAVAMGLQATLDALLLRSAEGFGESSSSAEPDDAQSCCCIVDGRMAAGDDEKAPSAAAAYEANAAKWACRACGEGEASVLVLPCRHLCLCKACEPRTDACPVCSGDKNAALHIATN